MNLGFTILVFGLCAVVTANQQILSLSQPVIMGQGRPAEPIWTPQNLFSSMGLSYPLQHMFMDKNASPMEDYQSDPLNIASRTDTNPKPLDYNPLRYDSWQNSLDIYSSFVSNDQPYQVPSLLNPDPIPMSYQVPNLINTDPFPMSYQVPNLISPNDEMSNWFSPLNFDLWQLTNLLSSPYDLNQQYMLMREGKEQFVPQWTEMESKIHNAVNVTRSSMVDPQADMVPWTDPRAEYTLILGVVLELMEQVAIHGQDTYESIFARTVLQSLAKIRFTVTPNELARQLVEAEKEVDKDTAYIRKLINHIKKHSIFCKPPFNLIACNKWIDLLLKVTQNQRLKKERKIMLAAIKLIDIFMENYADKFVAVAKNSMAYTYFGDMIKRRNYSELKPLVIAGTDLMRPHRKFIPDLI